MKIIVGLGNPGSSYNDTRHNVGFIVLDNYLGDVKWKKKFNAEYYEEIINGEKVLFVKPLTYMNLSGDAVVQFVNYYDIDLSDILVVHDDLDLKFGTYKLKTNSSDGGHNGIKSIINRLNSKDFARLKIGISHDRSIDTKDYVLGNFSKEERKIIVKNEEKILNILLDYFKLSFIDLMSKYNRR
jgi:PTH1 family peptidyl-tRNA hydrolase